MIGLRPASSKAWSMIAAVVFCMTGALTTLATHAESPVFVGVLEDVKPGNLSPAMAVPHVRIAFQEAGDEWIPFKTDVNSPEALAKSYKYFPDSVDWTVVYDGKKIGAITSKNPGPPKSYGDVGTQKITSDRAQIPKVTTRLAEFSRFGNPAKFRPLVLVSMPHFNDPEDWKPAHLTGSEKTLAVKIFRDKVPALEQCEKPEEKPKKMVPYADDEILLLGAFRSKTRELIFGERLDDKRSNCGFFDDELFFDYWFALDKNRGIRLLGSQMTPMDAVDLNGKGHSEWLFQTARGEDEDGYELFYDDFGKKASFHWTYH